MEHLLNHLQTQLEEELSGTQNGKLEYIYEDLLDKTERALDELSSGSETRSGPDFADKFGINASDANSFPGAKSFTGSNFQELAEGFENLTGKDIRDAGEVVQVLLREDHSGDLGKHMKNGDGEA